MGRSFTVEADVWVEDEDLMDEMEDDALIHELALRGYHIVENPIHSLAEQAALEWNMAPVSPYKDWAEKQRAEKHYRRYAELTREIIDRLGFFVK